MILEKTDFPHAEKMHLSKLSSLQDSPKLRMVTEKTLPLIKFCMPLYKCEPAGTTKETPKKFVSYVFKPITNLAKTTPNYIIHSLSNFVLKVEVDTLWR